MVYNMKNNLIKIFFVLALFLTVSGCSEKLDLTEFNRATTGNVAGDTVYIPIQPAWTGFNNPRAICIGNEPFIYVADTDNDRIVMMNIAGQILGTRRILKPIAIAQDYQLNLIICAMDTIRISADSVLTTSAVIKLDMVAANHNIETAPLTRLLPSLKHPASLNPRIKYTGVAAFYDNSFYVSRTGPSNTSFIDPDNSILLFQRKSPGSKIDTLMGRMPAIEPLGTGILTANGISSLTSFKRRNIDFIATFTGNTSFKTQWLFFNFNAENPSYAIRQAPLTSTMMEINKFSRPEGVTIDPAGNIYVADAGRDSVYKFNPFGDELHSFGGPTVFRAPEGVAFFDRTLYVLDTGNNRILRFILSTDIR
ncbi:MAG: hypothetical protein C0425_05090 [Chlorobiaceae bacterium]|nr:hypothetical protein [Chlorobiaceae bacterium]MBA4309692.1 hypothetical protein [Chlorobiaceae bacterium]